MIVIALLRAPAVFAEPNISPPEPVMAVEDTRSHAAVLGDFYQAAATFRYLVGADGHGDLTTIQGGAGPFSYDEQHVRDLASWAANIGLRARLTLLDLTKDDRAVGPLTVAFQRFVFLDPVSISPLLFLHAGFDVTLATPWLSGHDVTPPSAIHAGSLVDTELASNGWDLRPASVYFRADLLLCRSIYVEAGLGAEIFVPTVGEDAPEYGLRVHAAAGFSLACLHQRSSWRKNLDLVIEYRGRAKLYKHDDSSSYYNNLALEIQHRGTTTVGISVITNFWTFVGFGARFALGAK